MREISIFLQILTIVLTLSISLAQEECSVIISGRTSCGTGTEEQCRVRGCCYDDTELDGVPACYFAETIAPEFDKWNSWSSCSAPCGNLGTRKRIRNCYYADERPAPSSVCIGNGEEIQNCNRISCGGNGGNTGNRPRPNAVRTTRRTTTTKSPCRDTLSSCALIGRFCNGGDANGLGRNLAALCPVTCNTCDTFNVPATTQAVNTTTTAMVTNVTVSTLPPTRYPPSVCEDEYDTCDRILELCLDPFYINETRILCRKSCNLCSGEGLTESSTQQLMSDSTKSVIVAILTTTSPPIVETTTAFSQVATSRSTLPPTTTTRFTSRRFPIPDGGNNRPRPDGGNHRPRPDGGNNRPRPEGGNTRPRPEGGNTRPGPQLPIGPRSRPSSERPRLLVPEGSCVDEAPFCESARPICELTQYRRHAIRCKKTCSNLCTNPNVPTSTSTASTTTSTIASTTTSAVTESRSLTSEEIRMRTILEEMEAEDGPVIFLRTCADSNHRCPEIAHFCNSNIYYLRVRRRCLMTCKICRPASTISTTSESFSTTTPEQTASPDISTTIEWTTMPDIPTTKEQETSTSNFINATTEILKSTTTLGPCDDKSTICTSFKTLCTISGSVAKLCPSTCNTCKNGIPAPTITIPTMATTSRRTTTTIAISTTTEDLSVCRDRFSSICFAYSEEACRTSTAARSACRRTCGVCSADDS